MTTPIETQILGVLERRGHARIGEVSDDMCELLERYVSPGAVRVHLSGMQSRGLVQRIGHGVYCVKGALPATFTLFGWAEQEARTSWPNAVTARSLQARRRVDRGQRVSVELMGEHLRSMKERGLVDETGKGSRAFIWRQQAAPAAHAPTAGSIFD